MLALNLPLIIGNLRYQPRYHNNLFQVIFPIFISLDWLENKTHIIFQVKVTGYACQMR